MPCQAQTNDKKVIFELKTKCMELARDYCTYEGLSFKGSLYDAKTNNCYVLSQRRDTLYFLRYISNVHTGQILAKSCYYYKAGFTNYGQIGEANVPYEKAEDYITRFVKRLTQE
jgi:hypothetical protein